MANPQKESGHVEIANDIFDALCKMRIPGQAMQVLLVIIRKTYGYGKKRDGIALSQFCLLTGIKKHRIIECLNILRKMNIIITEKGNAMYNFYAFNKDFDTWNPLPKKVTLPNTVMRVTEYGNASLPKMVPTINNSTINNTTINNNASAIKRKQNRKKVNGEDSRGKDVLFDNFLDHCKQRNILPEISERQYSELAEEYKGRVVFGKEARSCVDWLHDNGLKCVNAQRLRNRMKKAIEFAKNDEIKKRQEYQDKKFQPVVKKPINQMPIWKPPL